MVDYYNNILLFSYECSGKKIKTKGIIVNEKSDICHEYNYEHEYEEDVTKEEGVNRRISCILHTLINYFKKISIDCKESVYIVYIPLKEMFTGEYENYIRFKRTEYGVDLDEENVELYKEFVNIFMLVRDNVVIEYSKNIFKYLDICKSLNDFKIDDDKLKDFDYRIAEISPEYTYNKSLTINSNKSIWQKEIDAGEGEDLSYSIYKYKENNYILYLIALIDVICEYIDSEPIYDYDSRYSDSFIKIKLHTCNIKEFGDEDILTSGLNIEHLKIKSLNVNGQIYDCLSILFIGSYYDVIWFDKNIVDYNEIGMKIMLSKEYCEENMTLEIEPILLKGLLARVYKKVNSKEFLEHVQKDIIEVIDDIINSYKNEDYGLDGFVLDDDLNFIPEEIYYEQRYGPDYDDWY